MCDAVEEMTGQRPWILFKLCWRYFTPLICLVSRCSQWIYMHTHKAPTQCSQWIDNSEKYVKKHELLSGNHVILMNVKNKPKLKKKKRMGGRKNVTWFLIADVIAQSHWTRAVFILWICHLVCALLWLSWRNNYAPKRNSFQPNSILLFQFFTAKWTNEAFKWQWRLSPDRALSFFSFKVCCVCSFLDNEPLTYTGGYMFPDWAYHLGRAIALSSMVTVPLWTAVKLFMGKGTLRQAREHGHCLPRKSFLVCGLKGRCTPQSVALIIFSLLRPQRLEAHWYPVPELRKKRPVISKSEMDPMSTSRSDCKDSV